MIISFTIENWMSFKEPCTFSMVASRERQHKERVAVIEEYKTKLLPVAAIYGGNASGKSNFIKALGFIKKFVVDGSRPDAMIPVEPFLLDKECKNQPSKFKLEVLVDGTIFEFSFAADRKKVFEEKLIEVGKTTEKVLYHRKDGKIKFHDRYKKEKQRLQFAFDGTRDNQLFLTNSVSQNVDNFLEVYEWFKVTLGIITPDTITAMARYFVGKRHPLSNKMNEVLEKLDTGITSLDGQNIQIDRLPLSDEQVNEIKQIVSDDISANVILLSSERIGIALNNGELIAKKLVTKHTGSNGAGFIFELSQESDGTRRVIDLLPPFLDISHGGDVHAVLIIDELDRSLHTLLTRKLLSMYLNSRNKDCRSQILFTTHDLLLMDQNIFRRDEMWIAERDKNQNSTLIPLSDFTEIRSDKNIRKDYLIGRMGGIPKILLGDLNFDNEESSDDS